MNQLTNTPEFLSPFDSIRRYRLDGTEYWCARDLMIVLDYTKWQKFKDVIDTAKENIETIDGKASDHFLPVEVKSSGRTAVDFELSRMACYHIALACDSRGKDSVKVAKHYFAVKTRQAEIADIQPKQLTTRDSVDYIQAAETLTKLPDNRLTRLLSQMLVSELSLISVNQKQLSPAEDQPKQYTTATVRAAQLGYTAKQIGNGATLGKFIKQQIEPDFLDWQGQYKVNHYEVCEQFDQAIHNYFN
jgi:hypothetical protein